MITGDPNSPLTAVALWLLIYAIHSTLLIGLVWAIDRRWALSPSLRHTLWTAALVGGIATATLQAAHPEGRPWVGDITLTLASPGPAPVPALWPADDAFLWAGVDLAPPAHAALLGKEDAAWASGVGDFARRQWPVLAVALWLAGAVLAIARLSARQQVLLRSLGPRRPVMGPLAAQLRDLRLAWGVRRSVRLTVSDRIAGPAALGPEEICLPRRALTGLTPLEQESVLAHELAHIVRGDTTWRLAAAWIECLFFFQPLNRVARRGITETAEFLADDWAVNRTGKGVTLARCLAEVAGWLEAGVRPAFAAGMGARGSTLLARVERLLADRETLRETSRRRRLGAAAGALILVALLAPGVSARRVPPVPAMPEIPRFVPAAIFLSEPIPGIETLPAPPSVPQVIFLDGRRPVRHYVRVVIRVQGGFVAWS